MVDAFKVTSISRVSESQVKVVAIVYSKEWHKANRLGNLGQLYGIDISNYVYRQYGVKAYNPTVSDRSRARNGYKTIVLYYNDAEWSELPNKVVKVDFVNKKLVA